MSIKMKFRNCAKNIVINSSLLSAIRRSISGYYGYVNFHKMRKKFEATHYSDKIQKFKGSYVGKRCFIIGNGPSLKSEDLEKIRGEYAFAANRIHLLYDKTGWRPTFYMCQDKHMLQSEQETIASFTENVFIGFNSMITYGISLANATAYLLDDRAYLWRMKNMPFSDDCANSVIDASTVTYSSMQLAIYMGFTEIYLLGVDHKYAHTLDKNKRITYDPTVKQYFDDAYRNAYTKFEKEKGTILAVYDMEAVNNAYECAKYSAENHNSRIYNATRGGELEIFDRVDFDTLICD